MKDLPPGQKGVHIHEVGKCEGPQFTSAGGHFNPDKKQHGTMNPQGAHTLVWMLDVGSSFFSGVTGSFGMSGGTRQIREVVIVERARSIANHGGKRVERAGRRHQHRRHRRPRRQTRVGA